MSNQEWPLVQDANDAETYFEQWKQAKIQKFSEEGMSVPKLEELLKEAYIKGHKVGHTRGEHFIRLNYGVYREEGRL